MSIQKLKDALKRATRADQLDHIVHVWMANCVEVVASEYTVGPEHQEHFGAEYKHAAERKVKYFLAHHLAEIVPVMEERIPLGGYYQHERQSNEIEFPSMLYNVRFRSKILIIKPGTKNDDKS